MVQDSNVDSRILSLKYDICLMNQHDKSYRNCYTDNYQLNFRDFFMEESSIACSGFKLRFSATSIKDFKILSCLMIGLTEIEEYARGPCHMARISPLKLPAYTYTYTHVYIHIYTAIYT